MRIFHGPQNIGGMAGVLAAAQRELGVNAYSFCFETGNFRFKTDYEIKNINLHQKQFELLKNLNKNIRSFDVFHFYFGESLTGPKLWDVKLLKKLGKKVFFYFCGCDIRDAKATIEKYQYSACKECWPVACSANRLKALDIATHYADGIFVSTPDLLEFVPPGSKILPQPVDIKELVKLREQLSLYLQKKPDEARKIIIAHAPSNRERKGTIFIEQAIAQLQANGLAVELLLVENKPYEEAMRLYATADIAVDQLLIGTYGQYSVEMMALGKPIICYLRDDLLQHYPTELPIINANPDNFLQVLKNQIEQRAQWTVLGERGIRYVEQHHDSLAVAKLAINYYQQTRGQ